MEKEKAAEILRKYIIKDEFALPLLKEAAKVAVAALEETYGYVEEK